MSGPFGIPGIQALSTPSCSSRTRWARTDPTVARWFGTTTPMRMGQRPAARWRSASACSESTSTP